MSQTPAYTSIGQEIVLRCTLRCTLSDLDNRSKASLLKALLNASGIMPEIECDSEMETLITRAINNLRNS